MAQIFLAKAGGIGSFERYVVLKTILPDRADDTRFISMFLDEARLSATLNHQNIAQVYEVDEADGAYFMAMEYVHGENVRSLLENTLKKNFTIPLELAVTIVSGSAAGLHHAHERRAKNGQLLNIVHRDVSPANIMVGYDGGVKVLDFGIAKAEERSTKTAMGTIKGKYGYMSPEQCRGKPVDRRSDIFALGIVLYELTTLRRAFRGSDDFDTMRRIVNGDLVPPSVAVPGYPRDLEAIVLKALARDLEYRYQTAQDLLEALDDFMVKSKLSSSATALSRYMTKVFGSKREPWVDRTGGTNPPPLGASSPAGPAPGEATEIASTSSARAVGSDTLQPNDSLVPPRESRVMAAQQAPAPRPPSGQMPAPSGIVSRPTPQPMAAQPAPIASGAPTVMMSGPGPAVRPTPQPMAAQQPPLGSGAPTVMMNGPGPVVRPTPQPMAAQPAPMGGGSATVMMTGAVPVPQQQNVPPSSRPSGQIKTAADWANSRSNQTGPVAVVQAPSGSTPVPGTLQRVEIPAGPKSAPIAAVSAPAASQSSARMPVMRAGTAQIPALAQEPVKKKSSMMLVIILVLASAIIGGGAATMLMRRGSAPAAPTPAPAPAK